MPKLCSCSLVAVSAWFGPSQHVELLKEHMDELTIVAGAAIGRSHRFVEGRHTITGLNTPWNTLALWHVPTLVRADDRTAAHECC